MFPNPYQGQIFIAEHGSWNRTVPTGYRITLVRLDGDRAPRYEVFAEGWLQRIEAWGRPVDVLVMPDGALLVSDDRAGPSIESLIREKGHKEERSHADREFVAFVAAGGGCQIN